MCYLAWQNNALILLTLFILHLAYSVYKEPFITHFHLLWLKVVIMFLISSLLYLPAIIYSQWFCLPSVIKLWRTGYSLCTCQTKVSYNWTGLGFLTQNIQAKYCRRQPSPTLQKRPTTMCRFTQLNLMVRRKTIKLTILCNFVKGESILSCNWVKIHNFICIHSYTIGFAGHKRIF